MVLNELSSTLFVITRWVGKTTKVRKRVEEFKGEPIRTKNKWICRLIKKLLMWLK